MKNILIAFGIVVTVVLLFVAVSKAETPKRITIINSGKAGGSFNARTQMYKDGLSAAGYEVKFENIGKISQAVKMFKTSDEPTIMVYANNQVYKQDLLHREQLYHSRISTAVVCVQNKRIQRQDGCTNSGTRQRI